MDSIPTKIGDGQQKTSFFKMPNTFCRFTAQNCRYFLPCCSCCFKLFVMDTYLIHTECSSMGSKDNMKRLGTNANSLSVQINISAYNCFQILSKIYPNSDSTQIKYFIVASLFLLFIHRFNCPRIY